jgi:hypothetical protein
METQEILHVLPKLNINELLAIIEMALRLVQEERYRLTPEERKQQVVMAAISAIEDYLPGSDLLAFSDLESEDFSEDDGEGSIQSLEYHA